MIDSCLEELVMVDDVGLEVVVFVVVGALLVGELLGLVVVAVLG